MKKTLPTKASIPISKTLCAFLLVFFSFYLPAFSQMSIYYSKEDAVIGYAIGATNDSFERDRRAENDCISKGGKSPWKEDSKNGYGCYAIVTGRTSAGAFVFGYYSAGNRNEEQCIEEAKWFAKREGATENSLSVYARGCIKAPPQENQNNTTANTPQKQPEWSDWKSDPCFNNLRYRIKHYETYMLNQQYHYYFEVQNNYSETLFFNLDLLGENRKKEFGDRHQIAPGQIIEFNHKMTHNYIKTIRIEKICFKVDDKKYAECDDVRNDNKNNEEIAKALIDEINSYLHQIDDNNPTKKAIMQRVIAAQNSQSVSFENYINLLKNEKENAKKLLESLGKTAAPDNDSFNELSQREISLIKEIKAIEPNADVYIWEGNLSDKPEYTLQKKKENISYLESYLEKIKTNVEKEKEIQEKRKADEKEAFNSNMQKGDEAMNNKDYASAMNSYQAAKSSTSDTNDQDQAQKKYNEAFEAKKTAERKERVEKQKQKDKEEDLQYAGMAAGVGGAMSLINDGYSPEWFAMKFQLGMGYESLPVISNNVSQYHTNESYIETFGLPTFHTGFKLGFFNNKGISLHLNPQFDLGFSALSAGTSGGYVGYGSMATVYFGRKSYSKFKVFAEGGYYKKDGTFSYDADAAAAEEGSATDDVREGTFNYGVLKYGGGFMIHWIDSGEETYIRPAAYLETASFFESDTKPVLNLNLQVNLWSEIIFEFNYAKNYFIGGEAKYPTTLAKDNKDFFSVRIIRQGKLF